MDDVAAEPDAVPATVRGAARERIVDAAFRVLAARGSHGASIKEIARAAGVAAGLVHYYFTSKEALLLEVVRELGRRYREELLNAPLPADPIDQTRTLLAQAKERALTMPDWYRLLIDLDALALRDAALAKEVAEMKREVRSQIGRLVSGVEESLRAPLGEGPESYAAVLTASVDGLVVQKLVDSDFDLDGGFAALESLLIGLLRSRAG